MTQPIEYHVDESGIGLLRVNRPGARNALDWAAQDAFAAAVREAALNDALRVLIITGAGRLAFVSGGDLKELIDHPEPAAGERLNRTMSTALSDLIALPVPVIAAVNGDAIGGGCEILTACDLRVAVASARFSFRQVQNGLTTGWGGTGRLVELLGQSRAMELLLTGRTLDAGTALELGLIHRIVGVDDDVVGAAQQWATDLAALPRRALAATKALVHAAGHLSLEDTNRLETQLFINLWPAADHLEAMNAFTQKRPPNFNRDDHV
jgi:enoyl-CoA hydratase/carnithine racemase